MSDLKFGCGMGGFFYLLTTQPESHAKWNELLRSQEHANLALSDAQNAYDDIEDRLADWAYAQSHDGDGRALECMETANGILKDFRNAVSSYHHVYMSMVQLLESADAHHAGRVAKLALALPDDEDETETFPE